MDNDTSFSSWLFVSFLFLAKLTGIVPLSWESEARFNQIIYTWFYPLNWRGASESEQ